MGIFVAVSIAVIAVIACLYFFNVYWKRRRHAKQVEGKVKFYMFPRSGGEIIIRLCDYYTKANLVLVDWLDDNGTKVGTYQFSQSDCYVDYWPENEKRKYQAACKAIGWHEGDPTPLTSDRLFVLRHEDGAVATERSQYLHLMMLAKQEPNDSVLQTLSDEPIIVNDAPVNAATVLAMCNEAELTAGAGDDTIDTINKNVAQILKGAQFMMSKPVVYGMAFLTFILVVAILVLVATPEALAPSMQAQFDAIIKALGDIKNGIGLGN